LLCNGCAGSVKNHLARLQDHFIIYKNPYEYRLL
jgi:hypothetical protein